MLGREKIDFKSKIKEQELKSSIYSSMAQKHSEFFAHLQGQSMDLDAANMLKILNVYDKFLNSYFLKIGKSIESNMRLLQPYTHLSDANDLRNIYVKELRIFELMFNDILNSISLAKKTRLMEREDYNNIMGFMNQMQKRYMELHNLSDQIKGKLILLEHILTQELGYAA